MLKDFLPKKRHVVNRINAARYLKTLAELETPQDQFYYLRGLNAFVFEEMILTALKKHGFKIIRNKRYTGDGGIDGRAYKNDQHYLIQAKRYRKHINPAHVTEFAEICKRRKGKGLFVHTGRTGAMSREITRGVDIEMISGDRLLKLLLDARPKQTFSIQTLANSIFGKTGA